MFALLNRTEIRFQSLALKSTKKNNDIEVEVSVNEQRLHFRMKVKNKHEQR